MSDTTQSEEAAMYRWLRDRHQWFVNTGGNPSPWVFIGRDGVVDGSPCTGPELDAAIRQAMGDDAAGVQALGTRQPSLPRDLDSTIPRGQGVGTNNEPARREPTKVEPGSDLHLTLLMAPHGLNLVAGPDRSVLLAYARDVWKAAPGVETGDATQWKGGAR